jgi:hypothetical protein
MRPRCVELWYKVPFVLLHSSRVAGCAVQSFSVDLMQIQQEERLGLTDTCIWAEVLIKEEYVVKNNVAVTASWRDRERTICIKREEV